MYDITNSDVVLVADGLSLGIYTYLNLGIFSSYSEYLWL